MYVDLHSNKHVTVKYIAAHTGHTLEAVELQFLPLPQSTKDAMEEISMANKCVCVASK